MQPQESGIKTWQWVVTVIVIIILIVIGFMVFGNKGAQVPPVTDNTSAAPATQSNNVNRIVMSDQYPGNVVYLSSVQMQNAGWVAIHKDNAGQPGAIIGYAAAPAGINPVKVTLTESMIDGGTYYAMLHSDDGDGKFDATKDMPLKAANGDIIMFVFHASTSVGASLKG